MSSEPKVLRAPPAAVPSGARVVTESAEQLAERWSQAALEDARAAGRADAEADRLAASARALDAAVEQLEDARARAAADLAHTAVELAVRIARHILRIEIDAGHYDIERIVRETLQVSGVGRRSCVVHLNPIDAERLKHVPFRATTVIEPDHEIARGDVHVTTPYGVLVREAEDAAVAVAERIRRDLP